jgi:hypothetical protein
MTNFFEIEKMHVQIRLVLKNSLLVTHTPKIFPLVQHFQITHLQFWARSPIVGDGVLARHLHHSLPILTVHPHKIALREMVVPLHHWNPHGW